MIQPEVYVYIVDLKSSVPETVTLNDDGSYTVILNARYSYEHRIESYLHACRHIEHNDFERHNVQEIEKDAHKQKKPVPCRQTGNRSSP